MRTCDSANKLQQKHLVIEPWTFTHKLWAQTSGLQLQLHEIRQIFMPLHYLKPKFKVKSAVNCLRTIWCILYTKMASSDLITGFMQGFRMLRRMPFLLCFQDPRTATMSPRRKNQSSDLAIFATLNTQDYSCLHNYVHNKSPVDKMHQWMIKSFRINPAKKYIYEANYWPVMVDKQCSNVHLSVFDRGQNSLLSFEFFIKNGI